MSDQTPTEEVFSDTCVLLDFVQGNDRQPHSLALVKTDAIEIIVSDAVTEELENVTDRRADIYDDLLEFLHTSDEGITDYDMSERHVYFGENDHNHVLNLQMDLRDITDNREVLRRVRQFLREVDRRYAYLMEQLDGNEVMTLAPQELEWNIRDLIGNGDDARVVTDAAGWSANGGSGVFVTRDTGDIIEYKDELADLLREAQGAEWVLRIQKPKDVLSELSVEAD